MCFVFPVATTTKATGAYLVMHTRLFKIVKNHTAIITYFGVIGNNVTIDFATLASIDYSSRGSAHILHHSCHLSQPASQPNPLTRAASLTAGSESRAPCGTSARARIPKQHPGSGVVVVVAGVS